MEVERMEWSMLQYGMKYRNSKCVFRRMLAGICICIVKWETGRFARGFEPDAKELPEPLYSAKDIMERCAK